MEFDFRTGIKYWVKLRIEDLYNDFDKSAPYIRRDLDQDLADYLIECARELGRASFTIRFNLADPPDEPRSSRVRHSLNTYFLYLAETEIQNILQMFRRSAILFAIGLGILFAAVSLNRLLGPEATGAEIIFSSGLIKCDIHSLLPPKPGQFP